MDVYSDSSSTMSIQTIDSDCRGLPIKTVLRGSSIRLLKFWWLSGVRQEYEICVNASQRSIKRIDFNPSTDEYYEAFVNNLPFDMFEDEIIPAVTGFGKVLQIRFLLSISGMSRGQAFIRFKTEDARDRCIKYFHSRRLYSLFTTSHPRIVLSEKSRDNDQLVFRNLSSSVCGYPLHRYLIEKIGISGLLNTKIVDDCAILTFKTHWLASQARVRLLEGNYSYEGYSLFPEWNN